QKLHRLRHIFCTPMYLNRRNAGSRLLGSIMSSLLNNLLAVAISVVPLLAYAATEELAEAPAGPNLSQVQSLIISDTNQFRREEGRDPVHINAHLTDAAEAFAQYLAQSDKFSHEADGKEPWDRAREHGYSDCIVLENIAWQSGVDR